LKQRIYFCRQGRCQIVYMGGGRTQRPKLGPQKVDL